MYNVVVVGMGYVGLANAVLLAQKNKVLALDIDPKKIQQINNRESPFVDKDIEDFFKHTKLDLSCSSLDRAPEFFNQADFIIISTPTNYDEKTNCFDISSVEQILDLIHEVGSNAVVVIKSTVPIGFTKKAVEKYHNENILFSPEFLREGSALHDNLFPSRIVVGYSNDYPKMKEKAECFAEMLKSCSYKKDITVLYPNLTEAESIKLFSNSYLALRIAFFNELDSFAMSNNLNAEQLIEGICLDPRIGDFYNNPSFGYGGYCLPKDTKQLLYNFSNTPQNLISSVIDSNATRKDFIVYEIMKKNPSVVGIYRLNMKAQSDNFRQSSVLDIIEKLSDQGTEILIYEPNLKGMKYKNYTLIENLSEFKNKCDLIVANRFLKELEDVKEKVFTRDIYFRD